jgi:hypothetical protein
VGGWRRRRRRRQEEEEEEEEDPAMASFASADVEGKVGRVSSFFFIAAKKRGGKETRGRRLRLLQIDG